MFEPRQRPTTSAIGHGHGRPCTTPFTSPNADWIDRFDDDPANALAYAYDIVCNGNEIGGGSIRIHRADVQQRVFDAARAWTSARRRRRSSASCSTRSPFGPPPHGGIAFGWDRICMLLAGTDIDPRGHRVPEDRRRLRPAHRGTRPDHGRSSARRRASTPSRRPSPRGAADGPGRRRAELTGAGCRRRWTDVRGESLGAPSGGRVDDDGARPGRASPGRCSPRWRPPSGCSAGVPGATIVLADPEDLGGSDRSVVARARVARNPFSLPRTLVVKHYLGDPAPGRPDPFRYEVASCQLFTALRRRLRPSPVLIAHDPSARLLVLEDLGRSSTLADKLFGPDGAAAAALPARLGGARWGGCRRPRRAGRSDFGALLRRLGERAWRDPMADEARAAFAGRAGAAATSELGVSRRRRCGAGGPRHRPAARRHPLPGVQPVGHLPGQQPRDEPRCALRRLRVGLLPRHRAGRRLLPGAVPRPARRASRCRRGMADDAARGLAHRDRRPCGPTSTSPERLDPPPARRAAAVGVAVHVVAAAAASAVRDQHRSGPTPRGRPGSAPRCRTTGSSSRLDAAVAAARGRRPSWASRWPRP